MLRTGHLTANRSPQTTSVPWAVSSPLCRPARWLAPTLAAVGLSTAGLGAVVPPATSLRRVVPAVSATSSHVLNLPFTADTQPPDPDVFYADQGSSRSPPRSMRASCSTP